MMTKRNQISPFRWVLLSISLLVLAGCDTVVELSRPYSPKLQAQVYGPASLTLQTHKRAPKIAGGLGPACFQVNRIKITGLELVKTNEVRKLVEPFAYHCQGLPTIKAILLGINSLFAERGFITTQAYLPEQNILESKTVLIDVIPGKIEDLRYAEARPTLKGWPFEQVARHLSQPLSRQDPLLVELWARGMDVGEILDNPLERLEIFPRLNPETAMVIKRGDVLQIEHLQQGLDQINRVPGANAQSKLDPGTGKATSIVGVANEVGDAFRFATGFDINGSEVTGKDRIRFEVAKDNLIGINDTWGASLLTALDSNELTGSFSMPYKWATIALSSDYSEYLTPLSPTTELFGFSYSVAPSVSYTLLRIPRHRTSMDLSGKWSVSERYVNSIRLTPQKFTHVRLGVSELRSFDTWQASYGGGYSHGLDVFNGTKDPANPSDTTPRAQFHKLDANANIVRVFEDIGTLKSNWSGQWTPHPLYGGQQLTFGSVSLLRGFKQESFSADRGGSASHEFALSFPGLEKKYLSQNKQWQALKEDRLGRYLINQITSFEPYVFADVGYGEDLANDQEDTLMSIGGGVRYKKGRLSFDLNWGEPLYRDNKKRPDNGELFFNLSYKLL